MQTRRLTIVNRHYPPNPNITGENAWDLAKYLIEEHGIDVAIVHIDRGSEGGGAHRQPVGTTHPIPAVYEGGNPVFRIASFLVDGYRLVRKAATLNHGPIIIMTSPPLLPMWASIFLKDRDWILWCMDLFPEGFVASKQMSDKTLFYRRVIRQTYRNAPTRIIALGPQQKRALDQKYRKEVEYVILPCGVFLDQHRNDRPPEWKIHPEKIYLGYCGNCGDLHYEEFVQSVIDHLDPAKHHMVLAVYGTKAERLKAYARDNPAVTIVPAVPRSQLHHIDVQLVSLLERWTHLAVPSKAVSCICSGASMIFCGNRESDSWSLLEDAGWFVEPGPKMDAAVTQVISSLTWDAIRAKKDNARRIAVELNDLVRKSYATIASWAK